MSASWIQSALPGAGGFGLTQARVPSLTLQWAPCCPWMSGTQDLCFPSTIKALSYVISLKAQMVPGPHWQTRKWRLMAKVLTHPTLSAGMNPRCHPPASGQAHSGFLWTLTQILPLCQEDPSGSGLLSSLLVPSTAFLLPGVQPALLSILPLGFASGALLISATPPGCPHGSLPHFLQVSVPPQRGLLALPIARRHHRLFPAQVLSQVVRGRG